MASTFPAAIANEPPPLDVSSEDEDSEEFRSHGLKLDVPSGEPTPVSTPFKRPITKSPEKAKPKSEPKSDFEGITDLDESDDVELEIVASEARENSPDSGESEDVLPKENGTGSPDSNNVVNVNGIDNEYLADLGQSEFVERNFEQVTTNEDVSEAVTDNVEVPISAYTLMAAENCDNIINAINDGDETKEEALDKSRDSATSAVDVEETSNSPLDTQIKIEDVLLVKQESCEFSADDTGKEDKNNDNQTPIDDEFDNSTNNEKEFPEFQAADRACNMYSPDIQHESGSCTEDVPQQADDDFEDDDFGAFQSIPNKIEPQDPYNKTANSQISTTEVDDDDDFGDFAQVPVQSATTCTAAQASLKDTDDFADFQDCSFQSCDVSAFSTPPSSASDFSLVSSKIDSILKTLFVTDSSLPNNEIESLKSIDSEISISKDGLWAQVQDFEGSQGLMFKWLNSLTDKHLLTSLKIDTSTIMYHEKWGTIEVPKFAASLVQSPLQPKSCNLTDMHSRKDVHHTMVINNNNNIPDGMSCQEHGKKLYNCKGQLPT
ncbi:unnamed protein product [Orchesella dallaii]|uniref:Aftiphilin clathrin-binding box domain-containing protein n=1 Tax=Orchesella dallaii TaxID=48710 RepID=A0ABP1R7Z9_9HEXA